MTNRPRSDRWLSPSRPRTPRLPPPQQQQQQSPAPAPAPTAAPRARGRRRGMTWRWSSWARARPSPPSTATCRASTCGCRRHGGRGGSGGACSSTVGRAPWASSRVCTRATSCARVRGVGCVVVWHRITPNTFSPNKHPLLFPLRLRAVLLGIRAIWISHPHADHHLGLMRVLVARREAARRLSHNADANADAPAAAAAAAAAPPVLVLAPRPVLAWLREFRQFDPEATWADDAQANTGAGAGEDPYLVDVERCVVCVCFLFLCGFACAQTTTNCFRFV